MPTWVIYGLFPLYLGFAVGLLLYGLAVSLKRVPQYDAVAEAEAYLAEVQLKSEEWG